MDKNSSLRNFRSDEIKATHHIATRLAKDIIVCQAVRETEVYNRVSLSKVTCWMF